MNTQLIWRLLGSAIVALTLSASPVATEEPTYNVQSPCCRGNFPVGGSGVNCYRGNRGRYFKSYDFQTAETLSGKVISLESFPSRRGFPRTHLTMQTDKETIAVHIAPSWFLAERDFELAPQEKITVIGSRINLDGQEAIVAREIKKGDRNLVLRDRNGFPVWRRGQIN